VTTLSVNDFLNMCGLLGRLHNQTRLQAAAIHHYCHSHLTSNNDKIMPEMPARFIKGLFISNFNIRCGNNSSLLTGWG